MSEERLIRNGAPTLAGIKTASLFTCPYTDKAQITAALRRLNRRLAAKGLRVLPLLYYETRVLIYLYRPSGLGADLRRGEARQILEPLGYDCQSCGQCLTCLANRLRTQREFPHEIGLFLGYPPEDVRGFLENRPCKCTGCWKVYGDEAGAQRKFDQYKTCTRIYCRQWAMGIALEQLAVAG